MTASPDLRATEHPDYPTHAVAGPTNPLAMLVFLATDTVTFVLLIVSQIYLRRTSSGPGQGALDPASTLAFSVVLWLSSAVIIVAERQARAGKRLGGWLYFLTAAMGAVFLFGQLKEYLGLLGKGVAANRDLFYTGFYTLTGLHSFHILLGLPMLLGLGVLALRGGLTRRRAGAVTAIGYFWHFVDAVWVVLFLVLYVWRGP